MWDVGRETREMKEGSLKTCLQLSLLENGYRYNFIKATIEQLTTENPSKQGSSPFKTIILLKTVLGKINGHWQPY